VTSATAVVGDYMLDIVVDESARGRTVVYQSGGAGTLERAVLHSGGATFAIGACLPDEIGKRLLDIAPSGADLLEPSKGQGQSHLRIHVKLDHTWIMTRFDSAPPDIRSPNPFERKLSQRTEGPVVVVDYAKRPYPIVGPDILEPGRCPLVVSKRYGYEWLPDAILVASSADEIGGGLHQPSGDDLIVLAERLAQTRRGAVVTGGSLGAALAVGDRTVFIPAPRVSNVEIESGAGDWLAGCLVAALNAGAVLDEQLLTDQLAKASATVRLPAVGG